MAEYDYDIGVIGGGAAGLTVASGAAQLGARTLLVEKEDRLGGDCLHYGCVPSKTLIKSASVYHTMQHAGRFGLPEVPLPPVDFSKVSDRIRSVIDAIQVHDSEERFCGLGVKVEYGDASFVDEHTVQCGVRRITAKLWVIATGSSPLVPPIPGIESVAYWTNKDIFSLEVLPETLIVLGGGPIGCEMAQAFARLGSKVTLLQRNTQLLPRDDADMAAIVRRNMEADGIRVETGLRIRAVCEEGSRIVVEYGAGDAVQTVVADRLLVATGRMPNVNGLSLENAGVEYGPQGIAVDDRLRTGKKHIFAAGDVTGRFQFTHAAGYEGGIVISNAIFKLPRKVDYRWLPWCTYTDPELASIGMNEKRAIQEGVTHSVWVEEMVDNDRARASGTTEGQVKLVLDRKEKPLGVQIVGPHAGDLVAEWVAVLNGKIGLSTLASAVHPYPTLGEINKRIAGQVLSRKLFSDKVRKALSFVFDYKGRACTLDK